MALVRTGYYMERMEKRMNDKIPMINQVFKDAALSNLRESGLPESLIDGVDCSTYENMEESLTNILYCI